MKSKLFALALFIPLIFSIHSFGESTDSASFEEWKNRPSENFSDAEANFNRVRKMLLSQYYDSHLTGEQLYRAATAGMLKALNANSKDEWNVLMAPTEFREFEIDTKGEVTGIGVVFKFDENDSKSGIANILDVLPGSAAEKAGIKAGDHLLSVNGRLYKGLELRDIAYDIRGKAGESVKLKILRGDAILTKTVVREPIKLEYVQSGVLKDQIGWVNIARFGTKTSEQLRIALTALKEQHIKALIVDLRENQGGLFDQAVEAAGYFLPQGSTVTRVVSRDSTEETVKTKNTPIIEGIPIVLLTSEETSSGAELFAGSLADNLGAKLVGGNTHGKWNVQTVETLPNQYAIKFTTKLFKSPKGTSYQDVGMQPDIRVVLKADEKVPFTTRDLQKRLAADTTLKTAFNLLTSTQ